MRAHGNKYKMRVTGWELGAMAMAYVVVFVSAFLFVFLIFRAAHLISSNKAGINAALYAETHTYVVLIEIALWIIMARAAIRLKSYTRRIAGSQDGRALRSIADAMLLSFPYAILFDMASTWKTLFLHTAHLSLVTTLTNVVPLGLFLYLSILLFIGAWRLRRTSPDDPDRTIRDRRSFLFGLLCFLLVVVPYTRYFYHTAPNLLDDDGLHHFALSPGILVGVYILPFALVWLLGLASCLNLASYVHSVRGKLYRPMFRNLYRGILISYASTYLVQIFYVSNVSSNRFGLGLLFLLSLIGLLMIGYGLIYRGANQLYSLEH